MQFIIDLYSLSKPYKSHPASQISDYTRFKWGWGG